MKDYRSTVGDLQFGSVRGADSMTLDSPVQRIIHHFGVDLASCASRERIIS